MDLHVHFNVMIKVVIRIKVCTYINFDIKHRYNYEQYIALLNQRVNISLFNISISLKFKHQ